MAKEYLDYAGLKQYDAAIKKYIADHTPEGTEVEPYDDSALVADIDDLKNMDATLLLLTVFNITRWLYAQNILFYSNNEHCGCLFCL